MFEPRGRMIRSMYQPVIEKIAHLIKREIFWMSAVVREVFARNQSSKG